MRGQDDFSTGEPYRNNGGPCPAPQRRSHQTAEGLEDMAASMNIDEGASVSGVHGLDEYEDIFLYPYIG